jgi:hypothetical protein
MYFDVTTSYNSVDRAAWLGKVTSQRHACRTIYNCRRSPWQRCHVNIFSGTVVNWTCCVFLFDGENISFDASLVIYINCTNIPPIMIINRIHEHQNLLSLQLVSFLVGLRTYQHSCISLTGTIYFVTIWKATLAVKLYHAVAVAFREIQDYLCYFDVFSLRELSASVVSTW